MFHIRYRVNGEVHARRLARRYSYSSAQLIANRHDWRQQARDHFRSVSPSRVSPQIEDIIEISLHDGHTLLQRISFKGPNE